MEWLTRHDPTGESSRRPPSPPGLLWEEGRKGERLSSMRRAEDLHAEDLLRKHMSLD